MCTSSYCRRIGDAFLLPSRDGGRRPCLIVVPLLEYAAGQET